MHHKRNDLSRGTTGRAIHKLCIARSNDGLLQTCLSVMASLGIPAELSGPMQEVLGVCESKNNSESERKKTLHVKAQRRDNKKKRKTRDDGAAGAQDYGAGVAFDDDANARPIAAQNGAGPGAAGGVEPKPPAKKARVCSRCKQPGHNIRGCKEPAPTPAVV